MNNIKLESIKPMIAFSLLALILFSAAVNAQNKLLQFVDLHNQERASLGLGDLQWSDELAESSQQWANTLAFKDEPSHSGNGKGENIWYGDHNSWTIEEMFEMWLREKQFFIEDQPVPENCSRSWENCGHYSQIVWSETKQIGCAAAASQTSDYVVCQYDPPGNIMGQKAY